MVELYRVVMSNTDQEEFDDLLGGVNRDPRESPSFLQAKVIPVFTGQGHRTVGY